MPAEEPAGTSEGVSGIIPRRRPLGQLAGFLAGRRAMFDRWALTLLPWLKAGLVLRCPIQPLHHKTFPRKRRACRAFRLSCTLRAYLNRCKG